jgi:hypothetical protein
VVGDVCATDAPTTTPCLVAALFASLSRMSLANDSHRNSVRVLIIIHTLERSVSGPHNNAGPFQSGRADPSKPKPAEWGMTAAFQWWLCGAVLVVSKKSWGVRVVSAAAATTTT